MFDGLLYFVFYNYKSRIKIDTFIQKQGLFIYIFKYSSIKIISALPWLYHFL